MTAAQLFQTLTVGGCRLLQDGEQLRIQDPQHMLTDALRQAIREHKTALLALLAPSAPAHDVAATVLSTHATCTHQKHLRPSPPPYPGHPVDAPFRSGQEVWLYREDDHTPRFDAPVTVVQMRTLWPGEQDIGWRNTAGEVTWHTARLAVAVATQEVSL